MFLGRDVVRGKLRCVTARLGYPPLEPRRTERQQWAQRVSSVFKSQPFNWFLLAVSSGILRWHQMVNGSKTCELFSSNHVDSNNAASANSSGYPSVPLFFFL